MRKVLFFRSGLKHIPILQTKDYSRHFQVIHSVIATLITSKIIQFIIFQYNCSYFLFTDAVKSQSDASVPALNVVCASADELNSNFFEDALRVLTPGGSITITLPTGNSSVKRNLMFSGFTSVSVSTEGDLQKLSAIKPEFDVGAAAAVKLNPAIVATENNWNFDMDDGEEVRIIFIIDFVNEPQSAPTY